ncbi:uncharacterized protein MKZ38_001275 [Zalerion maritima]|uniref:Cytochrome P450 n=1 Tax=Zalerion maritima TaxID=339359 RepID=A0AAD5RFI2_9PEZI|nr:uncharacterized protein MKZ38_001275 [Zalerion maritima]
MSLVVKLLVVLVALFAGQLAYLVVARLFLSPLRSFPGPKWAALTEWWEVLHTAKCDRFMVIQKLHERHGPVVRIGPNQLSVASSKTFQHVFVTKCSSFVKSDFYATIQPGVGDKYSGLFNYTDHMRAMKERRDLQPMFSPASLKKMEARFEPLLDQMVLEMKKRDEMDMFNHLKYLLLDTIGDLAFGKSFGQLQTGEEHQYVTDFNRAFMLIGLQVTFSWLIPFIPYLPFKPIQDAYFGLQRVFKYARERVDAYLESDEDKTSTLLSGYLDTKTGQPKEPYTPWSVTIAGHGFVIAGSESSSITIAYMLYLLIKQPEAERRLRDELSTLPPKYSSTDLAGLRYFDAFLRETLRIFPPAPSPMPRIVPAGGFTMDGITYPPHTIISSQPYSIHRDPKVFDRPDAFDPDRWLTADKESKDLMTKAFVPFSAGQRGCVGRGLAWIHMQKTLARLLEEFEGFEMSRGMTDEDMELIERGALAKPRGTKLWVKYRVRET